MGFELFSGVWTDGAEKEEQEKKYYDFVDRLNAYHTDGAIPSMASPDIKFNLSLQRERLKKKGITLSDRFTAYEAGRPNDFRFCSLKYNSPKHHCYYNYHKLKHETQYKKGDKILAKFKDDESLLYQYSIYLNEDQTVSEKDTLCCPGCGAISTIETLTQGCPYCGASFTMSAIFPIVTSYFYNVKKNISTKGLLRYAVIAAIICGALAAVISVIAQLIGGVNPILMIITAIVMALIGAFVGYAVAALGIAGYILIKSFTAMPALMDVGGTKKKLEGFMQSYDPYFSYEYFCGTVQSMLKSVLLSDDPGELSFYGGKDVPAFCKNIIDSVFIGAMSLVSCKEENGSVLLTVRLYMNDTMYENEKLHIRPRKYTVRLMRKSDVATDHGFTIHNVSCASCGASFDATRQKHCSYCGSEYLPEKSDWVILAIDQVADTAYLSMMS